MCTEYEARQLTASSHLKLAHRDGHRLRILPELQRPSPYVLANGHVLPNTRKQYVCIGKGIIAAKGGRQRCFRLRYTATGGTVFGKFCVLRHHERLPRKLVVLL